MLPQSDENDQLSGLGRSRGGYSTKLHVLCDGRGTLLAATLTGGQRNESTEFDNVLAHCDLSLYRHDKRPEAIAGDKGYSSKAIRQSIERRAIRQVIAGRSNESTNAELDCSSYRRRNIVEKLIGWLKESRRVANRYDKTAVSYIAFVQLASTKRLIKLLF